MPAPGCRVAVCPVLAGLAILLAACAPVKPTEGLEVLCPHDGMAFIPAGWFTMGEDDGRTSNQPQHLVFLDDYCIDMLEVTRQAFIDFLDETGYQASGWLSPDTGLHSDLPATGVLWDDAYAYCQWAGLRLPTEAEWEKAARGTDGRRYPWGNDWDAHKANNVERGLNSPVPVGSFPPGASPYGLQDMCGNAAEWVSDRFDFEYYSTSPEHNPTGPDQVLDHGLRGGSFASTSDQATTFFRDSSHSIRPNPRAGFRCALSIIR